jgi:predicted nucleotidyltransferase
MWKDIKFYNSVHYPIPDNEILYQYITETQNNIIQKSWKDIKTNFSWTKKSKYMDEYIDYIDKWSRLFKHIPCIRQVYLCNSITFNALHENSDIDLCIITRSQYLRFARIFSWIAISITGLKRKQGKYKNNRKKFCLSFYIDEWYSNIYHLRKRQWDVYLSYWLAHSVLLYSDTTLEDNYFMLNNKQLLAYLPNHPLQQSIQIGNRVIKWNSFIKNSIEFVICNSIGLITQSVLWWIRWTCILWYKKQLLSQYHQKEIIITSTILKFHEDKRNVFQHKRKIALKKDI